MGNNDSRPEAGGGSDGGSGGGGQAEKDWEHNMPWDAWFNEVRHGTHPTPPPRRLRTSPRADLPRVHSATCRMSSRGWRRISGPAKCRGTRRCRRSGQSSSPSALSHRQLATLHRITRDDCATPWLGRVRVQELRETVRRRRR